MPNWVKNEIIFENSNNEKVAALIRELRQVTKTRESEFDFNKFIPMPESLKIEDGSCIDESIAYYVTERLTIPVELTNLPELISNSFHHDWANEVVARLKKSIEMMNYEPKHWDEVYELGKQYMFNHAQYGCYTWYEWSYRNWGTKWNASEVEWQLKEGKLCFQTPWSAPFPVIQAMSEVYPDLEFTHRWADEDIGSNCGVMWYSGGYASELEVDSLSALGMDIWGFTEDDFDDTHKNDDDKADHFENFTQNDEVPISEPEVETTTIDSGLSIFDLI